MLKMRVGAEPVMHRDGCVSQELWCTHLSLATLRHQGLAGLVQWQKRRLILGSVPEVVGSELDL